MFHVPHRGYVARETSVGLPKDFPQEIDFIESGNNLC
jgi:hypothetical protein